jgi:hypothetical protein
MDLLEHWIDPIADAIWPLDELSGDDARDELRRDVRRGLEESGLADQLAALEDFVRDVAEEPFYGGTPECSDRARALMNNEEGDRA